MAVLGAAAGLERDDPLDLDLRPAPLHPDLVREVQRGVDGLVGQLQHLQRLRLVEADAPLEDLLTGDVEDHAGISSLRSVAPSGRRPRIGAIDSRSSRLQSDARSGSRGQEPITMPRQVEAAALDRLDRQSGVVERAEAGAGDDDQRRVEQLRDVGDRPLLPKRTSRPPAPSITTRPSSCSTKSAISRGVMQGTFARAAERSGESGSG